MVFRRVKLGEHPTDLDIQDVGPDFMKEINRLIELGQGGRIWLSPDEAAVEIGLQIAEREEQGRTSGPSEQARTPSNLTRGAPI